MREIKFRGWYTGPHVNRMLEPNFNGPVNEIFNDPDNEGKVIYMQYTGLKDKDGREIYEGDLVKNSRFGSNQLMHVKWSDAIEEVSSDGVEWTRQKPGFVFEKISKGMTYVFVASKDLEVIGNIYENPELLEELQNGTK